LNGYSEPYAMSATTPIRSHGMILLPEARGMERIVPDLAVSCGR
jgi:hypothetical protein